MWFRNLLRFWTNWKNRKSGKRARKPSRPTGKWVRSLLTLEPLENRWAPATFTVTTLDDEFDLANATVSLREALYYANNNNNSPGTTDLIDFDVSILGGTIELGNIGAYGDLYIGENVRIDAGGAGVGVDFVDLYHLEIIDLTSYVAIDNVDLFDGYGTNGGAIANYVGANLYLSALDITNSYAFDDGGAIYQFGGNLTIYDVFFSYNAAYYSGGAIYFTSGAGDFYTDIDIRNSQFDHNIAGFAGGVGSGGAIALFVGEDFDVNASLYIGNTDFLYNYADGYGGAVSIYVADYFQGQIDVVDSYFGDPAIPGSGNYAADQGGAINLFVNADFDATGNVTIDGSTFYYNSSDDGGAINIDMTGDLFGTVDIDYSYFLNNYAFFDGGGVDFDIGGDLGSTGAISFFEGGFYSNFVTYYGGGANIRVGDDLYGAIDVTGTYFDFNDASTSGPGFGGGLHIFVTNDVGGPSNLGSITLDSTSFYNNYAYEDGGGVDIFIGQSLYGAITISNSYFNDNVAAYGDGGGVSIFILSYVDGGDISILNSKFYDNYANDAGGGFFLYVAADFGPTSDATLTIDGSTFGYYGLSDEGNTAGYYYGGGVYVQIGGDLYGDITISDSTFDGNDALSGDGGGAFLGVSGDVFGNITVSDYTLFENNYARYDGGGLAVQVGGTLYGNLSLSDANFDDNYAYSDGGGLYVSIGDDVSGTISFDGVAFFANYAGYSIGIGDGGGADILISDDVYGAITFLYTDFGYNYANGGDGGGVNIEINSSLFGDISFTNGYFYENDANYYGGGAALFIGNDIDGGSVSITNVEFYDNDAFLYDGGGFFLEVADDVYGGAEISVLDSSFFYNYAGDDGGGLAVNVFGDFGLFLSDATFSITGSDFGAIYNDGNYADDDGGGVNFYVGADLYGNFTVTTTDFYDNHADDLGGAINIDIGNATDYDGDFEYAGNINIIDSGFRYNSANTGGAIALDVNAVFQGASYYGGELSGDITIDGTTFRGNTATYYGGAINIKAEGDIGYSGNIDITYSSFYSNNAFNGDGGAINIYVPRLYDFPIGFIRGDVNGNISIANSIFSDNNADGDGGAFNLYVGYDLSGDLTITDTDFRFNDANYGDGGAVKVHVYGDLFGGSALAIHDSGFYSNSADEAGGAIYLYVGDDFYGLLDIDSTTIADNIADAGGGGLAMFVYDEMVGDVYLYDVSILDNYAGYGGGGAYFGFFDEFHGNVYIDYSTFYSNVTGGDGGGLSVNLFGILGEGNVTITATTIDSNDADGDGGGIEWQDSGTLATLFIGYSAITRNDADYDGGGLWLYTNNGYVTIVNSTIAYNDADSDGGGIYLAYAEFLHLSIYNSTIAENYADNDGGGIFADETSDVYLLSTIVANNTAQFGAGNDLAGGGDFYTYYSLIGDSITGGGSLIIDGGTGSNIYDVDPLLGSLALNGGPTETMALLSGSPAIDTGFNPAPLSLSYDQRGFPYDREVGSQTDIGAFERQDTADVTDPTIILYGCDPMNQDVDTTQEFGWSVFDTYGLDNVTVTITKDGVGIFYVSYDPASDLTSDTFNFDAYGEGTFELVVTATDTSGNTASEVCEVIVSDDIDAPDISITGCTGTEVESETQFFTWAVTDPDGVADVNVTVRQDGVIIFTSDAFSDTFNFDSYGTGEFEIEVFAEDTLGNTTTETHSCTVIPDEAPDISITGCTGTEVESETQFFTWAVTDPDGVADVNVTVRQDGVIIFTSDSFSDTFNFDSYGTGEFEIEVFAEDTLGNTTTETHSCTVISDDVENPAFAVGSGAGQAALVQVYQSNGALITTLNPFPGFAGGVTVALGDVNNDGVNDVIAGAGPGGGPHVKVFNGVDFTELDSFFAFSINFTGGVFVSSGDIDGDGFDDVIVGAGAGGGPHVKVFDVSGAGQVELESFFAFSQAFTGGVRVGAGDVNDDGADDIIVGAGPGGGPHVRVFDADGALVEIESFFAFAATFTGGIFVAGGDVNNDGFADIIVGNDGSLGTSAEVRVFDPVTVSGGVATSFLTIIPYPGFNAGVRVGSTDFDGDGDVNIITGAGAGGGPHVKVFDDASNTTEVLSFFAFSPSFTGGVFVGGF